MSCHACGHTHPTMAHSTDGTTAREWCHEDDHSCYNDNRGRYYQPLRICELCRRMDGTHVPGCLAPLGWQAATMITPDRLPWSHPDADPIQDMHDCLFADYPEPDTTFTLTVDQLVILERLNQRWARKGGRR